MEENIFKEKRDGAGFGDYHLFNLILQPTDKSDKEIKFLVIETEEIIKIFDIIKEKMPHRLDYYALLRDPGKSSENIVLDQSNLDEDNKFSYYGEQHSNYSENSKDHTLIYNISFIKKKTLKVFVYSTKIDQQMKNKVEIFAKTYVHSKKVKRKGSYYLINYNTSYSVPEIVPENDYVVIITDENLLDEVIKNNLANANKILIQGSSQKSRNYVKSNPKIVKAVEATLEKLLDKKHHNFD